MRNLLLNSTLLFSSFLIITPVAAENMLGFPTQDPYVSIFAGLNFLNDIKTDTNYSTDSNRYDELYRQDRGQTFRGAFGGNFNEWLRGEIELGVSTSQQGLIRETFNQVTVSNYPGTGDIRTYTALANLWADIGSPEGIAGIRPYLGGGIGMAFVDPNLKYTSFPKYGPQKSSVEFAAQAGVGFKVALNEIVDLGLGYRLNFVNGPKTRQTTTTAGEVTTYNFDDMISQTVGITLTVKLGKQYNN